MSTNNDNSTMSKSKQKRLAQENARKEQRKKKAMTTLWTICIPAIIVAIIVCMVLYSKSLKVNYSKYLTENGTIENVTASNYMTGSYESMNFAKEDLMPDEMAVENDIDSAIDEHKQLDTAAEREILEGDQINISYTSTVNGEVYDQVTVEDGGEDITVGDNEIDAAIDASLIGRHPGETFNVTVAYPDDYYDEELKGNAAIYAITVAGIYNLPNFDDEFVQTYYSDKASTAEGYRQAIVDEYFNDNLSSEIEDSISLNCVVETYPEDYLNNTIKAAKAMDKENFEYYKQMYSAYGIQLNSIYEMYGLESSAEYDAQVTENAKEMVMKTLFFQKVMEDNNLTNTKEEVKTYCLANGYDEASYNEAITKYGYNYVANIAMNGRMLEYVKDQIAAKLQ